MSNESANVARVANQKRVLTPEEREPFHSIPHPKKRCFLIAYAQTLNTSESAKLAKIDRTLVYYWKQQDPEFAAAFEVAKELGIDALEDQCRVESKKHPVLAIFLLKGARPDKYKDRTETTININVQEVNDRLLEGRERARQALGEQVLLPPAREDGEDEHVQ